MKMSKVTFQIECIWSCILLIKHFSDFFKAVKATSYVCQRHGPEYV